MEKKEITVKSQLSNDYIDSTDQFQKFVSQDKKISYIKHNKNDEETKKINDTFYELLNTYLKKVSNDDYIDVVNKVVYNELVYISTSDFLFPSLIYNTNGKLSTIILNPSYIDIDLETGETSEIDECYYSIVFGIIKASIISQIEKVSKDIKLHSMLITYIYYAFLKQLSRNITHKKQKDILFLSTVYLFYRHFLKKRHPEALSMIRKEFKEYTDIEDFDLSNFENVRKYDNIRYIIDLLIEFKAIDSKSAPSIIMGILRNSNKVSFYSFISTIDNLVTLPIMSNYPTSTFSRYFNLNTRLESSINQYILNHYVNTLEFYKTERL